PVGLLEAEQAVGPLRALGAAGDRQLLRLALELRQLGDVAELLGRLLRDREAVGVRERRRRLGVDRVLGHARLGLVEGRRRVVRHGRVLDLAEAREDRARVLGVGVHAPGLQRHLLRAEVELLLDLVAGRLQRLGVDLAEDELLGEVLGADRDLRLARVRGVALDRRAVAGRAATRRGGLRGGAAPAVVVVVVAAAAGREAEDGS